MIRSAIPRPPEPGDQELYCRQEPQKLGHQAHIGPLQEILVLQSMAKERSIKMVPILSVPRVFQQAPRCACVKLGACLLGHGFNIST